MQQESNNSQDCEVISVGAEESIQQNIQSIPHSALNEASNTEGNARGNCQCKQEIANVKSDYSKILEDMAAIKESIQQNTQSIQHRSFNEEFNTEGNARGIYECKKEIANGKSDISKILECMAKIERKLSMVEKRQNFIYGKDRSVQRTRTVSN